jgi:glucose/arabinose dehydrogenase
MRFKPLARRITLAPMLVVALALTVAACSSSGSSSSAATSPSAASAPASPVPASAPASSSAPSTGGNSAAVAQITANWEKFFSSSTPVSEKVTLLQNGSTFEAAIKAFANFPLASSLGAKVTNVTVNSATSATVTYSITTSSGSTLLPNQKGTAVYQDGVWKVGDASLCGLFKLIPGGTVPSACSSAG